MAGREGRQPSGGRRPPGPGAEHHLPLARAAGIGSDALDLLMAGGDLRDPLQAAVVGVRRSLVATGHADPQLLEAVEGAVGPPATFELVVLIGYYRLLATILRVYRID